MITKFSNIIDIVPILEKRKQRDQRNHPRNKYGICELCGQKDFRQNGACYECIEKWEL